MGLSACPLPRFCFLPVRAELSLGPTLSSALSTSLFNIGHFWGSQSAPKPRKMIVRFLVWSSHTVIEPKPSPSLRQACRTGGQISRLRGRSAGYRVKKRKRPRLIESWDARSNICVRPTTRLTAVGKQDYRLSGVRLAADTSRLISGSMDNSCKA